MPLASATCRVQAPAASTTTAVCIGPLLVCTPVTLPPSMQTSVTSVLGDRVAPFAAAARETDGDLCRIEVSIVADAQRGDDTGRLQERIEAMGFFWRDLLDVKAHSPSTIQVGCDDVGVLGPSRDFQAA